MLMMLGLTLLGGAGWVFLGRYELRLGRQAGPWIATMLNGVDDGKAGRR